MKHSFFIGFFIILLCTFAINNSLSCENYETREQRFSSPVRQYLLPPAHILKNDFHSFGLKSFAQNENLLLYLAGSIFSYDDLEAMQVRMRFHFMNQMRIFGMLYYRYPENDIKEQYMGYYSNFVKTENLKIAMLKHATKVGGY